METNSVTEIQLQKCTPKRNLILVKADPVEQVSQIPVEGLDKPLELPDDAQTVVIERIGTVVEVGPETREDRAMVGERVLFSAYAGTPVLIGDEVFKLMLDEDVLAGI